MTDYLVIADAAEFGHMSGWGWGVMLLSAVLAVAVVVSLLWALTQSTRGPLPAVNQGGSDPEQILADRFARGDIDEEEFRARRAALRSDA